MLTQHIREKSEREKSVLNMDSRYAITLGSLLHHKLVMLLETAASSRTSSKRFQSELMHNRNSDNINTLKKYNDIQVSPSCVCSTDVSVLVSRWNNWLSYLTAV